MSKWRETAVVRLKEITSLEKNWDSYGAVAPSTDVANAVLLILTLWMNEHTPIPDLVPGSSGEIQIELHRFGYDIELTVNNDLTTNLYVENCITGAYVEHTAHVDTFI